MRKIFKCFSGVDLGDAIDVDDDIDAAIDNAVDVEGEGEGEGEVDER